MRQLLRSPPAPQRRTLCIIGVRVGSQGSRGLKGYEWVVRRPKHRAHNARGLCLHFDLEQDIVLGPVQDPLLTRARREVKVQETGHGSAGPARRTSPADGMRGNKSTQGRLFVQRP
jgi:hypothetical protein